MSKQGRAVLLLHMVYWFSFSYPFPVTLAFSRYV